MPISERLKTLGSGVFGRVDAEKRIYRLSEQQQQRPLIDLSLGSSDLKPPPRLLQVMAEAIAEPPAAAIACKQPLLRFARLRPPGWSSALV